MRKSSFVALVLGTISGMLFAIGMCMALLPEWNAFKPGVVMGAVGIILGLITLAIWRKMTGKQPVRVDKKTLFSVVVGIAGALLLGVGMCFCMVWSKMVLGIVIGIVGIVVLLMLIPLTKGLN